MLRPDDRDLFDRLLDAQIEAIPPQWQQLLEEVPLIVDDEPSPQLLESVGLQPGVDDLCGLHDGIALTERSVEHDAMLPEQIMLFRGPIMRLAGYRPGRRERHVLDELDRQIHITLLHEIGHHFGLDEDELASLGYG